MSAEAEAWVWNQKDITATECLVLLRMANRSDEHGVNWLGQDGIAAATHLRRETVCRTVDHLVTKQKLERSERRDAAGRMLSCRYRLVIDDHMDVIQSHTDQVIYDHMAKLATVSNGTTNHTPVIDDHVEPSDRRSHDLKIRIRRSSRDRSGSLDHNFGASPPVSTNTPERLRPEDLMEGWNHMCAIDGLPKVMEMTASRRQKALQRLKEHPSLAWWKQSMANIANSAFCRGMGQPKSGEKPWKASFDWLVHNDSNAVKAYEGRYN